MFKTYHQKIILAAIIIGAIALGGCSKKTVVITYQPLVNSKEIKGNVHIADANTIYMTYCISKIQNTQAEAVDFQFDLARIKVGPNDTLITKSSYDFPTAKNKVVKAGTTEFNLGTIVIRADITGEPNEGKNSWRTLHYKSTGEESVLILQYPSKPSPDYVFTATPTSIPVCYDGALIPE